MARKETEPNVQQSLLDRLTEEPPPRSRSDSVAKYRESVRRDVEWLLNTRRVVHPAPEELQEVRHSLYHYGLPDVSSLPADSPESSLRLVRWIEEAVELFEPRLSAVRVSAVRASDESSRRFHFLIDAQLEMEPDPEQVVFDTYLEVASCRFAVK